jgi:hypothetical protein
VLSERAETAFGGMKSSADQKISPYFLITTIKSAVPIPAKSNPFPKIFSKFFQEIIDPQSVFPKRFTSKF